MKKWYLLTLSMLFILQLESQEYIRPSEEESSISLPGKRHFSLTFAAGMSIPESQFASNNVKGSYWDFHSPDSTHLQGFALSGFHFDISCSYLFTDMLGIEIYLGGNTNSFDISTFQGTIGYPAVVNGSYYIGEYLAGFNVLVPVAYKISFEFTALGGLMTANYPEISYVIQGVNVTVDFNSSNVLGFNFGGAFKYAYSPAVDFVFKVEYSLATMVYPGNTYVFSYGYYSSPPQNYTNDITKMPAGILKPEIGISFKF